MFFKITVGDELELKKAHPCGSHRFIVRYAASDVKICCLVCGREVLLPRIKLEKAIRSVKRTSDE